ncbi:MAG: LysR family transcriptional regulator [Clostridia bacterium]|nr:LysR family transcriptional regulator [Clostridia bacterium]
MLDFRMETFLTVCKYLNYTRAAEALDLTQPAVTQHIQHLQTHYGVKLFEYKDKRLRLTPEGVLLRDSAATMLHDEQKLMRDLKTCRAGRQTLRFGATLTIGGYELPPRLASYLKAHPDTDVHMTVENTQTLLSLLDQGILDFALVEGYFQKSEYDHILWSTEPYICVCAPDHRFTREPPRLEDLFHETIILRDPGSGSREVLSRVLEERNFQLSDFCHITEISDLQAIKSLTEADCGITFLYRKAAERELTEGRLREIPVEGLNVRHEFTFLWRKDSCFEGDFRALYEALHGAG